MGHESPLLEHARMATRNGFAARFREMLEARPDNVWAAWLGQGFDVRMRDRNIQSACTPESPPGFALSDFGEVRNRVPHLVAYLTVRETGAELPGSLIRVSKTAGLQAERQPFGLFIPDDVQFALGCLQQQYEAGLTDKRTEEYLMDRLAQPAETISK